MDKKEKKLKAKVEKLIAKLDKAQLKYKTYQRANCPHSSMSGNGEKMTCNKCGYVKVTSYYY